MNNQDWDDYAWQREGTAYGDMAKDHNDAILGKGKYAPQNQSTAGPRRPAKPRPPMTGEVTLNRWCSQLDNAINALIDTVSWKVWAVLGVLCAVPAAIVANQQQLSTAGILFVGGFNLLFPWLLAHAARLTIYAVTTLLGYCLIYTYFLIKVAIILGVIAGIIFVLAKVMQ